MTSKRALTDIALSMISSALPLFVLQFLALPYAAKQMSSDENGVMLSVYSFVFLISSVS